MRALREVEAEETGAVVCRKLEISKQTLYIWKQKDAGVGLSEIRELRWFRGITRSSSAWSPISVSTATSCRRSWQERLDASPPTPPGGGGACRSPGGRAPGGEAARGPAVDGPGSRPYRDSQDALRIRLREFARSRVRFGYRRLTVLLRREGWPVNAKRIYRLYAEDRLILRSQPRKRVPQRHRVPQPPASAPNQR